MAPSKDEPRLFERKISPVVSECSRLLLFRGGEVVHLVLDSNEVVGLFVFDHTDMHTYFSNVRFFSSLLGGGIECLYSRLQSNVSSSLFLLVGSLFLWACSYARVGVALPFMSCFWFGFFTSKISEKSCRQREI